MEKEHAVVDGESNQRQQAREQFIAAMLEGRTFREGSAGSSPPVKRTMAYRFLRAAVLSLHTDRLVTFFEKARLISDDNCVRRCECFRGIYQQFVSDAIAVPFRSIQQILDGTRSGFSDRFCHLPPVFARSITHQSLDICESSLMRLWPNEV